MEFLVSVGSAAFQCCSLYVAAQLRRRLNRRTPQVLRGVEFYPECEVGLLFMKVMKDACPAR